MAEVVMRCVDGPFAGLEFTVPDKTPFRFEVSDLTTKAHYIESVRVAGIVEVVADG